MNNLLKIGIDIDGTITYAPDFFRKLTNEIGAEIHIITARSNPKEKDYLKVKSETEKELKSIGISYTKIAFVDLNKKVKYIEENGISVMFDDTDESVIGAPSSCIVFKIRESMNFCWNSNRWVHSDKTSVHV